MAIASEAVEEKLAQNCYAVMSQPTVDWSWLHVWRFNPLESRGNYSAKRNNEVGTLADEGWAVTFGTARRGMDGAAARPGPSSLYQM